MICYDFRLGSENMAPECLHLVADETRENILGQLILSPLF